MGNKLSWLKSLVPFLRNEELRILMNGLDAAGKTTVLYRLKLGEVVTTIPTIGFNVETLQYKNISITCWDVGGRDKIRPLWRHYYQNTQVILHVIDSNDRDRIDEARAELHKILNEDELRDCLVLILANKQDIKGCMSVQEIKEKLELDKLTRFPYLDILPTSAINGDGLEACMNWIATSYQLKKLGSPIQETLDDMKSLVASKKPYTEVASTYISSYLQNLTVLAQKLVSSSERSAN